MTQQFHLGDKVKHGGLICEVWGVSHDRPMRYDLKRGREFYNSIPENNLVKCDENRD